MAMVLPAGCGGAALPAGPPQSGSGTASIATSRAAPPAATMTPSPTPACSNLSALESWSVSRLAWQVIVVPAEMTSLNGVRGEVASGAGGILLFGATAPSDLASELAGLASTSPGEIAPLVMSDVEGGDVERAANLLGPMPSARQLARTMSAAQITAYGLNLGRRLRAIGMTMDLAPVMDLDAGFGPSALDPDGTRSFSDDAHIAATDAAAFSAGLAAAGVVAVAKHFPGLHGTGDNTDEGPAQTSSWPALQDHELVPFKVAIAAGEPAIMLSNASVPGLSVLPASISPQVVAALRDQLGFRGLLLTDSLTAGSLAKIGYTVPRAATAALIAGVDMVIYNGAASDVATNASRAVAAIEDAVNSGTLPLAQLVESVSRVLAVKHVDLCGQSPPAPAS
jgi:beta-N-acetylhexosaminidase